MCSCQQGQQGGLQVMQIMEELGIWRVDAKSGQCQLDKLCQLLRDIKAFVLAQQLEDLENRLKQLFRNSYLRGNSSIVSDVCDDHKMAAAPQMERDSGEAEETESLWFTDEMVLARKATCQRHVFVSKDQQQSRNFYLPPSSDMPRSPMYLCGCGITNTLAYLLSWLRRKN
jgi:hypothetical protein